MIRLSIRLASAAALLMLVSTADAQPGRGGEGRRGGGAAGAGAGNRGGARPQEGLPAGRGPAAGQGSVTPRAGAVAPAARAEKPNGAAATVNRNIPPPTPRNGKPGAANLNRNVTPNNVAANANANIANVNRNRYNVYRPANAGYWGLGALGGLGLGYGGFGYGGIGAWGIGSPAYAYGYMPYSNPYAIGYNTGGSAFNYSQPVNLATAQPDRPQAENVAPVFDQAQQAFRAGDYDKSLALTRDALTQSPNDADVHEFLALVYFAQGKYDQAAAPLYAILSVGPGWDWSHLINHYDDPNAYTNQLRSLESFTQANAKSAQSRFVLAYHYICQNNTDAAASELKVVTELQPKDTLSAQLLAKLQPSKEANPPAPAEPAAVASFDANKLNGTWTATPAQGAKVTFTMQNGGAFSWAVAAPGQPAKTISGTSSLNDGVLTLNDKDSRLGALAGQVAWQDDTHFTFRAVGAPADDPGLKFAR